VLLVGVILGLYLIVAGKLNRIGRRELSIAVAAVASVAGTWYFPVIMRHGDAFIDSFIIEHHFERYFTTVHRHPQPVYFFLFILLAGLMPWTFLLFPAIARIRTLRPRASERDSLLAFSWIWLAVPLLFFSFSGSKLPGYILPVFPALAIIIGAELERVWRGERSLGLSIALWLNALLLLAIGIAFIIYLRTQGVANSEWQFSLKLAPLAVAIFALLLLARSKMREFLLATGVVVMLVIVGAVVLLLPKLSYTLSYKSLSLEAAAQLRPGERIGFFRMKEFAPAFYSQGRVVCGTGDGAILNANDPERLIPVLERESSIILFTEKNWLEGLERDERFIFERIGEQRKAIALRVSLMTRDPD
ncbi:MAG TPA: hypothetical protein VFQ92_02965, partial [Blastocatellia bacterium]|nr:hypothetical protein [Blastocatellia bacterium]